MSRWASQWPTAHPRARGVWTVRRGDRWGVLDPERGRVEAVDPAADRRLPGLAAATHFGQLLGYRAGRRAIVAGPRSFIKVVRPGRVTGLIERHQALSGSGSRSALAVPTVRTATSDGRVELSPMDGASLHQCIRRDPGRAFDDIGELVATLHGQPAPTWLPIRQPDDPKAWAATARRSPTAHQPAIERVAEQLPALEARAEVIVHGDLHDKNIICGGTRMALIDLDGLALGAPEDDLANLAVHLELRNLQAGTGLAFGKRSAALYRSYRAARHLDVERLLAVERHTWFRLACLYQYRTGSAGLVPLLLLAAGRDLGQQDRDLTATERADADLQ